MMASLPTVDPFALAGGSDAEMALRVGVHTHQVAVPFTPLRLGELDDFVSRWAGWLAEAAAGRLQRLSSNSSQAAGSSAPRLSADSSAARDFTVGANATTTVSILSHRRRHSA